MAKRETRARRRQVDPTLEKRGEQYERAILRGRREHQRRVTMLARGLRRATEIANRERIATARALIAGTDYKLIEPGELERWQKAHDAAEQRIEELAEKLRLLEAERYSQAVIR